MSDETGPKTGSPPNPIVLAGPEDTAAFRRRDRLSRIHSIATIVKGRRPGDVPVGVDLEEVDDDVFIARRGPRKRAA